MIPIEVARLAEILALERGDTDYDEDDVDRAFRIIARLNEEGFYVVKSRA